jgi:transglutaminase-like putative cysteine protease
MIDRERNMRLKIHHVTSYDYPRPVSNSVNEVWLRPLTDDHQACLSFTLTTTPRSQPRPYTDYYGNTVYHFDIPEPHAHLEIVADAEVMTDDRDIATLLSGDHSSYRPLTPADHDRWLDFLSETPLTTAGPAVRGFVRALQVRQDTVAGLVREIADRVHTALAYQSGTTDVATSAEEALDLATGVCQDFTHLFLAVSRQLGVPARYVSGYLGGGGSSDQPLATHAWVEVLLPTAGWLGLDVTNGLLVDAQYAKIAIGRDYYDVPPVRGAYAGLRGSDADVAVSIVNDQQQ